MTLVVLAGKDGYAPVQGDASPLLGPAYRHVVLTLAKAHAFAGIVRDQKGKPVPGAEIQFGVVEKSPDGRSGFWGYAPIGALRGTPLESFFLTRTDDQGRFRLAHVPADKELILRVTAAGMADLDTGANGPTDQFFAKRNARPAELVLGPEARVRGQVVTKLPGVSVGGLSVVLQGTGRRWTLRKQTKTNAAGRFSFAGLGEGTVEVMPAEAPEGTTWTARAVRVDARPGDTAEATIELIGGVRVEGRVVIAGTEKPAVGALVIMTGPARPANGPWSLTRTTDAEGKYHFRLPPGETEFSVRLAPKGFTVDREKGAAQKVEIPANVKTFAVPPLAVVASAALKGRVLDARGRPVAGARIVALCRAGVCAPVNGPAVLTDTDGRFRLEKGAAGPFPIGELAALQVALPGGQVFDVNTVAVEGGVKVQLPTTLGAGVKGPPDVEPDELAGVVIDDKGRPLEGVHVHVWDWVDRPENQARTGKDGVFRIKKCGGQPVEVRFRKPGYSPVLFLTQPTGVKDWVVALDSKTYFEGVVRGPDGKPAPNARIRADQGLKELQRGYLMTHVYTDTKTDAEGRYRLYVCPDAYEVSVGAPGIGVARLPKTTIDHGQARVLDIKLQPGITFRARAVDAQDGRPVAGVRLWNWLDKQVKGRSDAKGEITIDDMVPGRFEFSVEAPGYTRWWSAEAASKFNRLQRPSRPGSDCQRNFDNLDFDMKPGMQPVTIVVEKGVRVRGRVLDPDGQTVAGATVAPALTGTGKSLTGDTRFSVATNADGRFEVLLPASGPARYNLVAHDGKYQQWRKWANGVLPPFRTTPGQEINDVTLTLSRPAAVRGKVVDAQGKPVAQREVRAHAADKLENRYYDPTTQTREDGTFELRFIRPGDQFIQAAPFYLDAEQVPPESMRRLRLKAGETVEGVVLRGS
jgi:protocatechuate 3,4-dioxygenase beta subunit